MLNITVDVEKFERNCLDCFGRYTGPDLQTYGFPFVFGDYVEPGQRTWAAREYKEAKGTRKLHRHLVGLSSI